MKKHFKYSVAVLAISMAMCFAACSDSDTVDTDPDLEILNAAVPQYVDNVVVVTYKSLADETMNLYDALVDLKADKSEDNVKKAVDAWIATRNYWELSEAFLYGAAADFGIDPHIDTWPLDKAALVSLLNNQDFLNSMDSEDGPAWAGEKLGPSLLGFHGIEYILFENGNRKSANSIKDTELIYAVAVSGDLRNQCIRLEASWAGLEKISQDKQDIVEEFELGVTMSNKVYYGEDMKNAGKIGSTYKSILDASETILDGCVTIADEVGTMKIGKPYTGADKNYLESPYSYNSKVDFIDNIISVRNAYLGTMTSNNELNLLNSDYSKIPSVSNYIKKKNPDMDQKVLAAINNAITKIDAIPYPFDTNFGSDESRDAMGACKTLVDVLNEAKTVLRK